MAVFKPFKAFRPAQSVQDKIPALPYDVMNSDEAREAVKGNELSFLHVDKAEIDLDKNIDIYDDAVYQKAKENLEKLENEHFLCQDETPCFYIYRQKMGERTQTGLVGCASIDDYINNNIKKHELTRADKEADRIRHVDTCDANTGPIFLTYKNDERISAVINAFTCENEPVYDFNSNGVQNTVWVISDSNLTDELFNFFSQVESLYIADGHHRCASAVKVGLKRREENPNFTGNEEFNFFLAVAFPDSELEIMDYNRVVADLNGNTTEEFLNKLNENFSLELVGSEPFKPTESHTFGMYIDGKWYKLSANESIIDKNDPVLALDVSILQNYVLSPILGIGDPRTDKRIDFIGGIRGLKELERRANDDMKIAFSMYPTTVKELMDIADADKIMPPKSTWFEPKLLSGLFIHHLS